MKTVTENEKHINELLNEYSQKHIAFRYFLEKGLKKAELNGNEDFVCFFQIFDSLDKEMRNAFFELRDFAVLIDSNNSIDDEL